MTRAGADLLRDVRRAAITIDEAQEAAEEVNDCVEWDLDTMLEDHGSRSAGKQFRVSEFNDG